MGIEIKQTNNKEIIALSTFEAVRLRPEMYISQIMLMEDKLPIIKDNKICQVDKKWSPGFMHLIVEILENAIDEAKRMKGKMKNIFIDIDLDTNQVSIKDEGNGFYNASHKHSKTKKNVVRTAFEELHAGSNFSQTSDNLIGTHGVGSAVCNILSELFEVTTINKTHRVQYTWNDYKVVNEKIESKKTNEKLGTEVKFIPSKEVFPNFKWDKELIETYLSFKQFLIKQDKFINKLKITGNFILNGIKQPILIYDNFLPEKHVKVETDLGTIIFWQSFENSCSISFVNGSQCTGIHQRITNDWINDMFKYNLAHHFYETLISLNVPSSLMRFADQNKTKYSIGRNEIEEIFENNFKSKLLKQIKLSDISKAIEQKIEERNFDENIKIIKKANKTSKRKISEKYSPPSKKKEYLYLCEGLSSAGSIKQARNSETEGVYALKGKIKNAQKLSDLTSNTEILEIMSILGLDPTEKKSPSYSNIVIASDNDMDGHHISSLIINLFYKWFPHIIEEGKLFRLNTPLIACDYKNNRKYFYSLEEFNTFAKANKVSNVNYLKGLGSHSTEDWEYVMKNKNLYQITNDKNSTQILNIIFGDSSEERKKWLAK